MKDIISLNEKTINDYLLRHVCPYMSFVTERVVRARRLSSASAINTVFRVELETNKGKKTLILRQAADQAPDGTPMDPARQEFEMKTLYYLQTILPVDTVATVLAYDSGNHVMTLSDLGEGQTLEGHCLLGKIPMAAGGSLGRIMATIHGRTRGIGSDFFWNERINDALVQYYFTPRIASARTRAPRRVEELWYQSKTRPKVLLCGNLTPANILIQGRGRAHPINFEQSMVWDPSADLGLFVGTLLALTSTSLKGRRSSVRMMNRFLEHYLETMIVHGVQASEVA
ncbi:MAG: hypothetical protein AAB733_02975 [Patescibacteria group bacterium]